jgi:arsenate reductase-like glutaredoxin family protein
MKKRNFLLLEVLIAFSLITICAIPLIKQPLKFYREEIAKLEQIEKERIADWTFTEIKEILLKNEIPWKKLPDKGETTSPFHLPPSQIQIFGKTPKMIKRSFVLTGRGEKQGLNSEVYRQLGVYVFLNDEKYTYRIPVQKLQVQ